MTLEATSTNARQQHTTNDGLMSFPVGSSSKICKFLVRSSQRQQVPKPCKYLSPMTRFVNTSWAPRLSVHNTTFEELSYTIHFCFEELASVLFLFQYVQEAEEHGKGLHEYESLQENRDQHFDFGILHFANAHFSSRPRYLYGNVPVSFTT